MIRVLFINFIHIIVVYSTMRSINTKFILNVSLFIYLSKFRWSYSLHAKGIIVKASVNIPRASISLDKLPFLTRRCDGQFQLFQPPLSFCKLFQSLVRKVPELPKPWAISVNRKVLIDVFTFILELFFRWFWIHKLSHGTNNTIYLRSLFNISYKLMISNIHLS